MKRICHQFHSHKEAEAWEIRYYQKMNPDERFEIARTLKIRVYGKNALDVREGHRSS